MSRSLKKITIAVAIVAVVQGILSLPSFFAMRRVAKERPNHDMKQLQLAVQNFYHDYNAYPIISPYADHIGIADAELVHALTGTNPIINPNNTVYIQPIPDRLSPDDAYIDPWGTPYHVHIDTTFNRRVPNPQPDPDRPEIPTTVLVYSAGPDRDPTTWEDNITSWE